MKVAKIIIAILLIVSFAFFIMGGLAYDTETSYLNNEQENSYVSILNSGNRFNFLNIFAIFSNKGPFRVLIDIPEPDKNNKEIIVHHFKLTENSNTLLELKDIKLPVVMMQNLRSGEETYSSFYRSNEMFDLKNEMVEVQMTYTNSQGKKTVKYVYNEKHETNLSFGYH